ncbi:MAG: hypothetical protein H6678_13200 [Candidatus Delongbacteria bacterium]|nr:hypothetical protein [Candidatus Cloacimonadota bacterium]MCB9474752.1 hypothetical protein [Candidatus Delongbacteria bacterium]
MLASIVACSDSGDGVRNLAPTARIDLQPACGSTLDDFQFDPSASTDDQSPAESLRVRLDWEGDGIPDTEWLGLGVLSHPYREGNWLPIVEIRDEEGLVSVATVPVLVQPDLGSLLILQDDPIVLDRIVDHFGGVSLSTLMDLPMLNLGSVDYRDLILDDPVLFDPEDGSLLTTFFLNVHWGSAPWDGFLPGQGMRTLHLDLFADGSGVSPELCGRHLGIRFELRMAGCDQSRSLDLLCLIRCP